MNKLRLNISNKMCEIKNRQLINATRFLFSKVKSFEIYLKFEIGILTFYSITVSSSKFKLNFLISPLANFTSTLVGTIPLPDCF